MPSLTLANSLRAIYGSFSAFTPASLFTDGAPGVWYDPSDYTTLFQDSAGTTPVTAVEQPVGLMLDKSQGLVLGAELLNNGDFSQGTTGWTLGASAAITGGALVITSASQFEYVATSSPSIGTAGKFYSYTFTISNYSAGSIGVYFYNNTGHVFSANGTYTVIVQKTDVGGIRLRSQSPTAFTGTIDNISVKELAGNHAFQSTSASRPVLKIDGNGKYYLKFDGVDDSLSTNSISFTSTDKMSVFAGVRKLSDASFQCFVSSGTPTTQNQRFAIFSAYNNAAKYAYQLSGSSFSTLGVAQTANNFTAPVSNVVSSLMEISTTPITAAITSRANAASQTLSELASYATATTTFANSPLVIGQRADANFRFNGQLYSMIIVGKAVNAVELTSTEDYIAEQTGVTIA